MHKLYAPVLYKGEQYIAKISVEEYGVKGHGTRFYNLKGIKIDPAGGISDESSSFDTMPVTRSIKSISDLFDFVKTYDPEFKPHPVHESMIENGRPKVLYHQTENDITVFDTKRKGAGSSDNETPFGIFLKSSDRDIGLKGKKQMPLYARMSNPLIAQNRSDLVRLAVELSPEYAELYNKSKEIDKEYISKVENAQKAFNDFIIKNSQSPNRKTRRELFEDKEFNALFDAEDNLDSCEIVYDKKRMNDKYQVGSGRVVTVTHDTPFIEDIVPQPEDSVNTEDNHFQRKLPSDRAILADALESVSTTNEKDADIIRRYKAQMDTITKAETRLAEVNAEIKELSFAKGKRDTNRRKVESGSAP